MSLFSVHVESLVTLALAEDLAGGDVTTDALFSDTDMSEAELVAKAPLVLAGGPIFSYVLTRVATLPGAQPAEAHFRVAEGTMVDAGTIIATIAGATQTILKAERVGLNLLQRMSGVATMANAYQSALGDKVAITDTRKTTPGLRELQRYAVRQGGGSNHRYNLASGAMLKENHIQAAGGIANAVAKVRNYAPHMIRIEVEVQNLNELRQALQAGADVVMLDNFATPLIHEAVSLVRDFRAQGGQVLVEVSGNVTIERLPELAETGVDLVSSGALTHSHPAADISLLFRG